MLCQHAEQTHLPQGTLRAINHKHLMFHKFGACWAPRQLSAFYRDRRLQTCTEFKEHLTGKARVSFTWSSPATRHVCIISLQNQKSRQNNGNIRTPQHQGSFKWRKFLANAWQQFFGMNAASFMLISSSVMRPWAGSSTTVRLSNVHTVQSGRNGLAWLPWPFSSSKTMRAHIQRTAQCALCRILVGRYRYIRNKVLTSIQVTAICLDHWEFLEAAPHFSSDDEKSNKLSVHGCDSIRNISMLLASMHCWNTGISASVSRRTVSKNEITSAHLNMFCMPEK